MRVYVCGGAPTTQLVIESKEGNKVQEDISQGKISKRASLLALLPLLLRLFLLLLLRLLGWQCWGSCLGHVTGYSDIVKLDGRVLASRRWRALGWLDRRCTGINAVLLLLMLV